MNEYRPSLRLSLGVLLFGILSFCSAFSATVNPSSQTGVKPPTKKPIPITVLAGFLGSGKTTLLQNLLENNEGLRIGVIVNDVANVNIDSKLVSNENKAAGMVELQNGCACCSRSDELLQSVSQLVVMSDMRGEDEGFHHIVVEMSGVADPRSVRSKFQEAVLYEMLLMERVTLDTLVTLVDCTTYLDHLMSGKVATPDETPELYFRNGEEADGGKKWMNDVPEGLLEAILAGEKAVANSVADLITSQTEVADLVLMTKVDVMDDENELKKIEQIIEALNPRATVMRCVMGDIPLKKILGVAKGEGVVQAGVVDDHRDAIHAVDVMADDHACDDADCEDPSHAHSHDHDCNDPECTDSSHSHSHDHDCKDPDCTDSSHSHSHDHACSDPDCTDSSHSHSHDHSKDDKSTYFGIGSFVYRARRPFHPGRLVSFLRNLPVKRGLPDAADGVPLEISASAKEALANCVRSKGFVWCANTFSKANYWSHAGSSFELSILGKWWATLPREEWPQEAVAAILEDFDNIDHDENHASLKSVGDRRQEVVFIGPTLGGNGPKKEITAALDQCLLNDDEWATFVENKSDEKALEEAFTNPMSTRVMAF